MSLNYPPAPKAADNGKLLLSDAKRIVPLLGLFLAATLSMLSGFVFGRRHAVTIRSDRLEVAVLNVQQGEASWIRTPNGHFIVIGAGPPDQGRRLADSLAQAGAKRVDLLLLPYPYAEAIGGAGDLISQIPVLEIAEPRGPIVNRWQTQLQTLCQQRAIRLHVVAVGDSWSIDGAKLSVLAPGEEWIGAAPAAANNSLVMRLRWKDTAFLWAGGIERAGEDALMSRTPDISADWLRVAHFGTRNASSAEFLRSVSPDFAVISAGPNTNGYPNVETLARLKATGAHVYHTSSTLGALLFYSDGAKVTSGPAQ